MDRKMNIGIKYCGGCKAQFDRVALVEKIKSTYSKHDFEYVSIGKEYEYVLVINGCTSACADLTGLKTRKGFININSNDKEFLKETLDFLK